MASDVFKKISVPVSPCHPIPFVLSTLSTLCGVEVCGCGQIRRVGTSSREIRRDNVPQHPDPPRPVCCVAYTSKINDLHLKYLFLKG